MTVTIRSALRKVLRAEWLSANTDGYGPSASGDQYVRIHLGDFDDELGFPQVTLSDVSSTARNASGYYGMKADGSGLTQRFDGRIDVTVYTGSEDHVPADPELLAGTLGREVRELIHANQDGLVDPSSSELVANELVAFSEPTVGVDTDYTPPRYFAVVEAGYVRDVEPPAR